MKKLQKAEKKQTPQREEAALVIPEQQEAKDSEREKPATEETAHTRSPSHHLQKAFYGEGKKNGVLWKQNNIYCRNCQTNDD